MKGLILAACLFLSGCVMADAEKLLQAAGRDDASFCAKLYVFYGGGMVIPAPAVPVGGSYGYAYIGRTKQIGSKVVVDDKECKIEHGHSTATQISPSEKGALRIGPEQPQK